jgi:hypothetical protein
MLRKIVLALGLIFSFLGMCLTLIFLTSVSAFLAGNSFPAIGVLPRGWSFGDTVDFLTVPTEVSVTLGFIFLALGILFPKEWDWPEPEGEDQATSENEEQAHRSPVVVASEIHERERAKYYP